MVSDVVVPILKVPVADRADREVGAKAVDRAAPAVKAADRAAHALKIWSAA